MRWWPRSLLGQTLLAVAAALFLAQAVSTFLLYRVAEERRQEGLLTAAEITHWGAPVFRLARGEEVARGERGLGGHRHIRRGRRAMRGEVTADYPLLEGETNRADWAAEIERRLGTTIGPPQAVLVTVRSAREDPVVQQRLRGWQPASRRLLQQRGNILVAAVQWDEGGAWHVARIPFPRNDGHVVLVIAAQTFLAFVILMVVLYYLLRRITRPLAQLTGRVEEFAASRVAGEPLAPRGPEDVSRLIAAHNAMEARIGSLIDEKDVMLGAIGHDLKTPLAALRVRIESVEDEAERAKMAASIEDIARTLDDILSLARVGRADQPPEAADLGALVEAVLGEFEALGEPVSNDPPAAKIVARVHVTWLRRALRNLVSNALRYGGEARVTLLGEGDEIVLRVEDDGPGIPEDRVAAMLEPFQRGEASRNRATGGAGLGLTLARAIAEQHGGTLVLANRPEGGLRAEIRLPATA